VETQNQAEGASVADVLVRVSRASHVAMSDGRYLTREPTWMKGGPSPERRHLFMAETEQRSRAAVSCTVRSEVRVAPGEEMKERSSAATS
jgi:hypothetical protein